MGEVDGGGDPEVVGGSDDVGAVSLFDLQGCGDLVYHRLALVVCRVGVEEEVVERTEGAVQYGWFGPVDFKQDIVQLVRRHRGQNVLHRVNGLITVADGRMAVGNLNFTYPGTHLGCSIEIDTAEYDASAARCRVAHERRFGAGVEPDPVKGPGSRDCASSHLACVPSPVPPDLS